MGERDANDTLRESGESAVRDNLTDAETFEGRSNKGNGTQPPSKKIPTITVKAGEIHTSTTEAEKALLATGTEIYQRGTLVRPAATEFDAADLWIDGKPVKSRKTQSTTLDPLTPVAIVDELSIAARFEKWNERAKEYRRVDPPEKVARTLLSRRGRWSFPRIRGVLGAPTLRSDGTPLVQPGFDRKSGYYLSLTPDFRLPIIPERPTLRDAQDSLKYLEDLFTEFPFVGEVDRSVALSGAMTPILRAAMPVAPLHGVSAPAQGTGKTFYVIVVTTIATGYEAPAIFVGESLEEFEKKLNGMLLMGVPIVLIDNVQCPLNGDLLNEACTGQLLYLRKLGISELVLVQNGVCLYTTGNNLRVAGDMDRRTLLCRMDAQVERAELRAFKGNPMASVIANRERYIAAVLTIARAYLAAGQPCQQTPLVGFEAWCSFVREPLIWLGRADPVASQETVREVNPTGEDLVEVMQTWEAVIGLNAQKTTSDLKSFLSQGFPPQHRDESDQQWQERTRPFADFRNALLKVAGERGELNTGRLGHWLRQHNGRIASRRRFVNPGATHGLARWRLEECNSQ